MRLVQGYFASQVLYTAVQLGIFQIWNDDNDNNNEHHQRQQQLEEDDLSSSSSRQMVLSLDDIGKKLLDLSSSSSSSDNRSTIHYKYNKGGLLRILRLLVAIGILYEHYSNDDDDGPNDDGIQFGLSSTGKLLATPPTTTTMFRQQHDDGDHSSFARGMASIVSHWTEPAVWTAWSFLPDYILSSSSATTNSNTNHTTTKTSSPFQMAHGGMTLTDYYGTNPQSKRYRNEVAKVVSQSEIPAVLDGYDWKSLLRSNSSKTKTIVLDIGGGHGEMMHALVRHVPTLHCMCLDLPHVIRQESSSSNVENRGVELIAGDMFDLDTIPSCDVIVMKHVLCDWSDEDVICILSNCHAKLQSSDGKVILADAVLCSGDEAFDSRQVQVYVDVLGMVLMGDGKQQRMERSRAQLSRVAKLAGFEIESIIATASPSINITVLTKV